MRLEIAFYICAAIAVVLFGFVVVSTEKGKAIQIERDKWVCTKEHTELRFIGKNLMPWTICDNYERVPRHP